MKNFAYYIRMFIIVVVMFASPILATLSFCFNWNIKLKCLFTILAAVDFMIVLLLVEWWMEDFYDD